jgi:capsid protein
VVLESENFFVVHGYWAPREPCYPPDITDTSKFTPDGRQAMLWARFTIDEIIAEKAWGKRGFFGHTPIHTYMVAVAPADLVPLQGPQLTLLDTGCAIGTYGRLTAYCVEENRFIQTTHFGELVRK